MRVFNLIDRFEDDAKSAARKIPAIMSQDALYENSDLIPIHAWTESYCRNSKSEIGDSRQLPMLKDLFQRFIDVSDAGDCVIWCNDDTILHPQIVEYSKFHCSVFGACSFFRSDFRSKPASLELSPEDYAKQSSGKHIGRDAFAFDKKWLVEHWDEIPQFILGASNWDLCLAAIIRKSYGIKTTGANLIDHKFPADAPLGYCGHIAHPSVWNTKDLVASPSNIWNGKLFCEWAEKNMPELKFNSDNNLSIG